LRLRIKNWIAGYEATLPRNVSRTGAERIVKPKRRVFNADGEQLVIPGAERISTRASGARMGARQLAGMTSNAMLIRFAGPWKGMVRWPA
jgi:hypothetical protein